MRGGGGGGTIYSTGFFVQLIFAYQYVHGKRFQVMPFENLSSLDFQIITVFLFAFCFFFRGVREV